MSQPQWGYSQPSWNPQPSWGPQQLAAAPGAAPTWAPAARRRNPLMFLLLGLIGLALVALAALVVVNLVNRPSQAEFQNDTYQVPDADLNPPAIPQPTSEAEAKQWTTKSALYATTTPAPVRCNLNPIDVTTANDADLKSHFEALMACLVRVWEPPMKQAGFQVYRPTVTIYGTNVTTACGSGDQSHNAFYCGADQQVYWSRTLGPDLPPPSVNKFPGDEVLAHEFGHAIQGRTGILISAKLEGKNAGSDATELEYSRRLETQADCFAGTFLRSVSSSLGLQQSDVALIQDTFEGFGDDRGNPDAEEGNHGKGKTRRYWVTVGLAEGTNNKCNTFTAPSSSLR